MSTPNPSPGHHPSSSPSGTTSSVAPPRETTEGTVRVSGKCALTVGDTTVHIATCDGRTTARWQISGQRLVNATNSGCLTDPSAGRTPGTGVTVTPCNGSASQRWSLP